MSRGLVVAAVVTSLSLCAREAGAAPARGAGEYARHFAALAKLSVAVAEAMPKEQYAFRPHPDSMTFGDLMVHIASTNYQFCAGLKDADTPPLPSPRDKDGIVKLLSGSFAYCTPIIAAAGDEQMEKVHGSPDGRLPGRELLLAMYIHVAHHRGQTEIYLRDKGIKPPSYVI
ncbi:MAG: DinB family protein [Polyangia bacterium]